MTPVYVPLAVKNAALSIEESLPAFIAAPTDLRDALYIGEMYRRVAVGLMFISGIPDEFFVHLFHSARAFLHHLENVPDASKATSKSMPLFDAIACGDDEGAQRIATASRKTWNPDKEYQDDFAAFEFLLLRFFLGADEATVRGALTRYESVLDGARDVRLDLCKALFERKQASLNVALDAFIDDRRATLAEERDEGFLNPEAASTTALVSVELLAWLRLATSVGLRTQESYPLAPDLARMYARARKPAPDDWKSIESYAELS